MLLTILNSMTKKAKELLNLGFGTVNTHLEDGIMEGNGVLVALNSRILLMLTEF